MIESTAVIIPAYNAERFLARALESALAQTRRPDRIIVVDDASIDGTVELARGYAGRGHPVDVLAGLPNGGPGTARNRGIHHTDAAAVLFLDADDRWRPEHCARVLDALERHEHAGFSHAFGADADAMADRPAGARREDGGEQVHGGVWPLLYHSDVPQSAVAARRAALLDVGAYREGGRHAEDYDLWLRLALVAPYVEVRAQTFERGMHAGQATHDSVAMFRGAWEARHRLRAFAAGRGTPLDEQRWGEVLRWAYERDLEWAWQSRSRSTLETMLTLHALVPGGEPTQREWRRRARYVWPSWRAAAWLWDALPDGVRRAVRRRVGSTGAELEARRRSVMIEESDGDGRNRPDRRPPVAPPTARREA